jgi:DNA-binding protein HU-beta
MFTEAELNKTRLIEALARRTGLTREQARAAVNGMFDPENGVISTALQRNQSVRLKGFGTFEPRKRAARKGRNPRTGEPIRIAAAASVGFRAGKILRQSLR